MFQALGCYVFEITLDANEVRSAPKQAASWHVPTESKPGREALNAAFTDGQLTATSYFLLSLI